MWYSLVVADLGNIPDFIAHFESQLTDAKRDCKIGGLVEKNITALPGITEHRFNQLQEIEAVLNFLNIQLRKIRTRHFKKYLEGYARALTARDAEKYVDGEEEVVDFETIINEVALSTQSLAGYHEGPGHQAVANGSRGATAHSRHGRHHGIT
jgi:hypothetical protein